MEDKNKLLFQVNTSKYSLTLLSNEIITLSNIQQEDIYEDSDSVITISVESSSYDERLYKAFRNKELIQFIKKESEYSNRIGERDCKETHYDSYFKISEFNSHGSTAHHRTILLLLNQFNNK